MSLAELQALERDHRSRPTRASPVEFVRGEGCALWDDEGNEYLDFLPGSGRQQPRALPPGASSRPSASRPGG